MMQSPSSLFNRGLASDCHCYSPHQSQVTSKGKKRFLGFHPDWLPVLMTTVTKQRGGGREEASTKAVHPVNGIRTVLIVAGFGAKLRRTKE